MIEHFLGAVCRVFAGAFLFCVALVVLASIEYLLTLVANKLREISRRKRRHRLPCGAESFLVGLFLIAFLVAAFYLAGDVLLDALR